MGLIRLIIFLLILGVLWFMIRNFLNKQQKRQGEPTPPRVGRIVKCRQCDVHLPESEALQHEGEWFCTPDHKRAFLTGGRDA